MTTKEAIANIEEVLNSTLNYDDTLNYQLTTDDCDWLEIAKSALEKQTPKKPIINKENINNVNYKVYMCPCCKKQIIKKIDRDIFVGKIPYYCDDCGQALGWEGCEVICLINLDR